MELSLAEKLQALHVEALVGQAHVIRDHPPGAERTEQAKRYVRQAMYERTIGRITAEQESNIFTLLSFAMPDGWRVMHPTPMDVLTEGSVAEAESVDDHDFSVA